jgi:hypothetical protein
LSNVVEFQSSMLKLSARTNTIALNTTLNRMKLRDSPICEACPYKSTESLQHFLLKCPAYKNIRDQNFQEIVDHMNIFMPFLDFTELSLLQKLQFLIGIFFMFILITTQLHRGHIQAVRLKYNYVHITI